ncbi:matrixin family metalloprotease [Thiohalorhabdus sp. Cl-TMA]|uniref:Matrixin family metalloprotease n=1 Tax=Thiohalorhabdus methylotrophus TaxID=3242694 RepID=A0ABV4TYU2_9GAMM
MQRILLGFILGVGLLAGPPGAARACDVPIAYSIGEVDRRFDLSRAEFRQAIRDAARAWEAAAGRELFVHRRGADFRIHLRYGAIQQAAERVESLEDNVGALRERIETGKKRLEEAKERLRGKLPPFEERVRAYRREKRAFEARVRRVNEEGGASAQELRALEDRRRRLRRRGAELQAMRRSLKELKTRANRLAVRVNALVQRHNRRVREARELTRPGREFHQGFYMRTGRGAEQIAVNQYRGPGRLRFILAHELGHALGIGHVDDRGAVMYYLNEREDFSRLRLAAADRRALRRACGAAP